MRKRNWKQLAKELKECIFCTEHSRVNIVLDEDLNGDPAGIIITPANARALYCMEDVTDFCRVKRLSSYVGVYNGDVFVRIH